MFWHNTDAMITESSQQSSQHPQSGLLHGKWVKTKPYTCTNIKIPLKHMNHPKHKFQSTQEKRSIEYHGLREGAVQSSLEVSDNPDTSQSPNMGWLLVLSYVYSRCWVEDTATFPFYIASFLITFTYVGSDFQFLLNIDSTHTTAPGLNLYLRIKVFLDDHYCLVRTVEPPPTVYMVVDGTSP